MNNLSTTLADFRLKTAATLCASFFVIATLPANAQNDSTETTVFELSPFSVDGSNHAGYRPTTTNVLTRTNRNIIDVAQTVDILPAEFLSDTAATMQDEAFVYIANAQVRNSSAGSGPNSILIRGFTNGGSFTEGIETGGYRRDMFGYERMEVIKGPASAVQGRGTDSGYINFILKKPIVGATSGEAGFEVRSGKNGKHGTRVTFDKNFTIDEERGLYGRVATVYDKHDHYIDFLKFKTAAIYPSLRWVASEKTDLVLMGEFMDIEAPGRTPGHGFAWIPAHYRKEIPILGEPSDPITALNLPQNFNIGGPQDGIKATINSITLIGTHKFSDAIQYRQSISRFHEVEDGEWWDAESNYPTPLTSISDEYKAIPEVAFDPNGVYIPVQTGFLQDDIVRTNLQGDLNMTYGNDSVNFATLVGYSWKERDDFVLSHSRSIPTRYSFINLKDPERAWEGRSIEPGSKQVSARRNSVYQEFGYYIQQDANFFDNRLLISGGWRTDTGSTDTVNFLNDTTSIGDDSTVDSWRMAATYKITPDLSVYAIKSTQNDPDAITFIWSGLTAGDPRLDEFVTRSPSTELNEFGFKGYAFDGRVTATFSIYEIVTSGKEGNDRVDTPSESPTDFGTPILSALRKFVTDGDKGSGIELSVVGKVTERWDLNLAYGTLDTSQPITGGTRPIRHSPEYNASFFTKYSFRNSDGRGLTIRGGFSLIGPFIQQVGGSLGRIPITGTQSRIDLGANYRFNENWSVDAMLKNAANDAYIVTRTNPGRELRLGVRTTF